MFFFYVFFNAYKSRDTLNFTISGGTTSYKIEKNCSRGACPLVNPREHSWIRVNLELKSIAHQTNFRGWCHPDRSLQILP